MCRSGVPESGRLERLCGTSLCRTPAGDLRSSSGPRWRTSKIAMHMDVPVTRSAWMHESGLRAILSNWGLAPSSASNPTRPSIKKAPLCGAFFMDGAPGEIRTPDRSVRSLNCELVISYKSTTCDLDQSRYVVMKRVNESYLVMCWYIIATRVL